MFPSTTTTANGSIHAYPEQYHLFDQISPCSRNEIPSFFPYFSPTIDDGDAFLHHQQDLLSGQFADHLLMANASPPATAEAATSNTSTVEAKLLSEDISLMGPRKNNTSSLGRKRGSKKDRHSKILTQQGPRDRRMRLSLEIARPFFDLQDMLGFDKASKTVDWLMTNSREAIKKLARDLSHTRDLSTKSAVSSASEGEVVSKMDESAATKPDDCSKKGKQMSPKAKRSRPSRKASFNPLSKEYRAIARARARERTKTKNMMNTTRAADEHDQLPNPNSHDHQNQPTTALSPHTSGDQEAVSQSSTDKKLSSELLAEVEEPPSLSQLDHQSSPHETVDDTFSIFQYDPQINISVGLNSDDLISSLQNNDIMINFLQENWHMESTRPNSGYCAISNVHSSAGGTGQERLGSSLFKMPMGNRLQPQFIDMQFYPKPWEDYNS